jgi:hypothetical protein
MRSSVFYLIGILLILIGATMSTVLLIQHNDQKWKLTIGLCSFVGSILIILGDINQKK